MANSFVQVPPDSTGKQIDTWATAVLGYHRQGIVIADPSVDANVVEISSRKKLPVELEQQLDYDTGAGSATVSLVGIALPASGGPVAGGTVTNPIVVSGSGTFTTGGLTDAQLRATAVPISAASLPLPTDAAKETKQDSQITQETAINTILGATTGAAVVTDADGTIQRYLRGIVKLLITSGTIILGAGANAIGKLSANSGVDIGDVDVTSLPALPAGNNNIGDVDIASIAAGNNNIGDVDVASSVLPTGAATEVTLAEVADSTSVLDDWDETNRAAVNIIPSQVGITAAAGAVAANTPRVTLGSDDPAVAVLGAISGAKVITDANGTLQQYLRGLIYLAITAANYAEKTFYGTAQTVISTATDIAAGNFSGAPAATFNNNDAAVPNASFALAMGEFPDWAAAPVAGTVVELWGVLLNTDGTDDDTDAPATTVNGGARYFGSWIIAAADALQRRTIVISLAGVVDVDFYIKNGTAQNMNNDGGTSCIVKITPFSTGFVI